MPKNRYICDCATMNTPLVDHLIEKLPGDGTFSRIASFYKILGDSTRCKIIFALLDHEMCVCDIANVLCMTKSSISHQLSKMKDSSIVKCRRDGKSVYYSLDDSHVADIFTVTMEHIGHMEEKL
ncbi:MAG: winged helix-turn-helix transcriptional regulator [Ruminococcaceae bacterium]|nr:winged helix-turn-helix transcriptional regulator [Oscillospiraceae bacterium]